MANKARERIAVLDQYYSQIRTTKKHMPDAIPEYKRVVGVAKADGRFAPPNGIAVTREIGVVVSAELQKADMQDMEYMGSAQAGYLRAILEVSYAWELTKGIYQFDKDLFSLLWDTEFEQSVPQVLKNLPEYAVMINFPYEVPIFKRAPLVGVIAKLTYSIARMEYGLMYICFSNDGWMAPIALNGIFEAKGVKGWIEQQLNDTSSDFDRRIVDAINSMTAGVINILLYLCSEKPDINRPLPTFLPRAHPGKKHIKLPHQEQIYEVGYRIGAKIRAARAKEDADWEASGETSKTRVTHIRRAHWHTYWTGSRKNNEMKPILKWLNPILVGDEELIPALHS